ncbi:MAG: IPT/TIG domain-containing protein [Candidatus Kerfeldbacteria bacterium]|nr:IPT/TIG domain-containing protein [Candidatus Kerfeldbacteria bacterium]
MKPSIILLFSLLFPATALAAFGDTSVYIGQLKYGDGGFRTDAYFDFPEDIASDGSGNFYLADTYNGVIRKIDGHGTVSTVVGVGGYGDIIGSGNVAKFAHPGGVALDDDNNIYIADSANGKIKKYSGGKVTTLKADLKRPEAVFVRNNTVYFTDYTANTLYAINRDGSNLRTITASLRGPKKIYVRTSNDYAYITNAQDYTVVRVKLSDGSRSVIAGASGEAGKSNGMCNLARFKNLWGVTVIEGNSLDEDDVYVTDGTGDPGNIIDRDVPIQNTADAGKIRVLDLNGSDVPETTEDLVLADDTASNYALADVNCEVYLFAKDSETFAMNYPNAITRYGSSIYVAVTGISQVARFTIGDATSVEIFAGKDRFHNRNGLNGLPGRPKDLVITPDASKIYYTENNRVKMITTDKRRIKKLVGSTIDNYQKHDDKAWAGTAGRFSDPLSLALSTNQQYLYIVDRNNNRIREVNIKEKTVDYLTGAGEVNVGGGFDNGYQEGRACPNQFELDRKNCAYFTRPGAIVVEPSGKYAYVADTGNQIIRRLTLRGANKGRTKLLAGNPRQKGYRDGTKTQARFNVPIALAIDSVGDTLYVADRDNHAIRQVDISTGVVTTVTGSPSTIGYRDGKLEDSYLNLPVEVYYNDHHIYFAESGTERVRVADLGDGAVKLVSGDGNRGYVNGDRDNSQFDNPVGIVKKGKNLLVADSLNDVIRKIDLGDGDSIPYTDPAAVVSSVTPSSNKVAGSSTDTKALSIRGSNFQHGAIAYFGSFKANATYVNSDTELSVVIPFGYMDPGYYEVAVENIDGQVGSRLRAYSISDNAGTVPVVDYFFE